MLNGPLSAGSRPDGVSEEELGPPLGANESGLVGDEAE